MAPRKSVLSNDLSVRKIDYKGLAFRARVLSVASIARQVARAVRYPSQALYEGKSENLRQGGTPQKAFYSITSGKLGLGL